MNCEMSTIYNKITCTHEGWREVWREGCSWGLVLPLNLHNPLPQQSTGTLWFVQKAMPGAKRATEPREGPSPVTPKNASSDILYCSYFTFWLCTLNFELTWQDSLWRLGGQFVVIILENLSLCLFWKSHKHFVSHSKMPKKKKCHSCNIST